MFKKKPNIKQLSPLRSSDRRKLADQIIADLSLPLPPKPANDASPEDKAAATVKLTSLRNALLPENVQAAKFSTTAGPDLKNVNGTVYIGAHSGGDVRVLWVHVSDRLWPSIYTLWHNPRVIPLLTTPAMVVGKIQAGADLMTPGLANGPPFPSKAKKGALVAVASYENPSVPLAVGVCAVDVSALGRVQGMKGVAVEILSWVGDEVWSWSPSGKLGGEPPAILEAWLEEDEVLEITQDVGGVRLDGPSEEDENKSQEKSKAIQPEMDYDQREWTTQGSSCQTRRRIMLTLLDIDDAFFKALLFGIYRAKESGSAPRYGLDFPLKPSFIMAKLIQPYLPIFGPGDAEALQIKKTSWKNMKKFLKHLDKLKPPFCLTKDQGGETIISVLDFDHWELEDFKPYSLPKKAKDSSSEGKGKGPEVASGADSSVGQKIKIVALYKTKEKFSQLFGSPEDARGYHTATEIKDVVNEYIEKENLVSGNNKRVVKLNPFLANDVVDSKDPKNRDFVARGTIPRDTLADRVVAASSAYHVILRNTSTPDSSSKPKAGAPPKILITQETRSGNKTVTKISGLEVFFIPPQPLADELRKTCAGSTSVDHLVGSSPKHPVMEVMVQGPQAQTVQTALEKRGIDKRWIEVVDKTKKKK
ncbi:hypothetical protein BT63DRAFT_369624 [Microthyrium microscopicum]|uniref:SUI1 domain-containing protein n=1 Tax=Microthyrium microscopicum TaxID=703497 RepID=A0A6A6UIQ6_9PEZI|nr:hypothetical protein BT63DRAFT_369624 [Microthyrium microscopicum]